ncbi:MAG: cytochrome b/b6 domain-containing protein, partial [Tahibacter sp.]
PARALMMQWHMLLGLLLLFWVMPRITLWLTHPAPTIVPAPTRIVERLAKLSHVVLYIFMIVQPLLGVLLTQAGERAIVLPFTDIALPVLFGPDKALHEQAEDLHVWLGKAFYFVIGAHIAAALWHHWLRKDSTLRRML